MLVRDIHVQIPRRANAMPATTFVSQKEKYGIQTCATGCECEHPIQLQKEFIFPVLMLEMPSKPLQERDSEIVTILWEKYSMRIKGALK